MANLKDKDIKTMSLQDKYLISQEDRKLLEGLLLTGYIEKEYRNGPAIITFREPGKESIRVWFDNLKDSIDNERTSQFVFLDRLNEIQLALYLLKYEVNINGKNFKLDYTDNFENIDKKLIEIKKLSPAITNMLVVYLRKFQDLLLLLEDANKLSNF